MTTAGWACVIGRRVLLPWFLASEAASFSRMGGSRWCRAVGREGLRNGSRGARNGVQEVDGFRERRPILRSAFESGEENEKR